MPAVMRKGIGSSDKTNRFTNDEIHALLLMALGKSPNSEGVAVDLSKCQNTLDIYEAADKIAQVKRERILEMFEQPFFMAGVDETGDFLIGKFKAKLVDVKGTGNNYDKSFREFETIEPFKRYHSYEEVPEFIPVMTMVKLAYEGKEGIKGMPVMDHYDENLQAVFYHHGYPSNYDCMGMVTPCPV
jgi:hypothetical protein